MASCLCSVVLVNGIIFSELLVRCGNRSLGSNSIGCEGKFRLWPCHMNCYFVVKLFRSWLVLIAMPWWASASISHGNWPALPCRQFWLQLPWPMCRSTVSLWIIYGLCSSLTQEHWIQQWIMFTFIPPLKHLWTWLVAKKLTNGTKKQKQKATDTSMCLLCVCLFICGSKRIPDCVTKHSHVERDVFFLSKKVQNFKHLPPTHQADLQ